jgi:hypothetical protein
MVEPTADAANIIDRIKAACVGHPAAQIPWPHRLLHDAIAEIEKLRALLSAVVVLELESIDEATPAGYERWDVIFEDSVQVTAWGAWKREAKAALGLTAVEANRTKSEVTTGLGYWMNETSGVLAPAVEAYLADRDMTGEQVAAMRAYLRQWIAADWIGPKIEGLRAGIDGLQNRETIKVWLGEADQAGIDPL